MMFQKGEEQKQEGIQKKPKMKKEGKGEENFHFKTKNKLYGILFIFILVE